MIERTTPPIPSNLANNLFNPFPPFTLAMVKKSDNGNVTIDNSNPIISIFFMF